MSTIVACNRGHNSATTLVVDGEVKFYIEEERLTRRKYDGAPLAGLLKVFDYVDEVDHLIVCHTHRDGPKLDWTREDVYVGFIRKMMKNKPFQVHYVDEIHHELHAACAFINSGFETAACLSVDGAGSFLKSDAFSETGYEFETIFKASYPLQFEQVYQHIGTHSRVGMLRLEDTENNSTTVVTEYPGITKAYEAITDYCGFTSIEAGKTMGLSPYGRENPDIPPFITHDGWVDRAVFTPTFPNGSVVNKERFAAIREDSNIHEKGLYTQFQKDMAYKIQRESEKYMFNLIRKAHELTGETNFCIAGGFGLNCVANYKYWKEFPDFNIYCEPISHDGGTPLGAAKMLHLREIDAYNPPAPTTSIYYGPQYDPATYESDLVGLDVKDTSYDDVAKLIREGNIVTIFQGRSEGGPRALGNRSILFDPTIPDGKDIVNSVKRREFFRPFACSIKKEAACDWFDLAGREETPHMMYAVDALPGVAEKVPSVIHVDGTCRIQTVTPEQNEHYYNLIDAFEKLSEVPILFNTSFNLGGDPLVETIEDAVNTLNKSDIEYLYLPEIQKLVYIPNI